MPIKTIFLDRDGVINKEINYLHKINDFKFLPGIFDACRLFNHLGYEIVIITNQSGIARGLYKESDYLALTEWMLNQFKNNYVKILDIFHCPHLQEDNCNCRKPNPGMILKAQTQHDISLDQSWLIGDKESDILAAKTSGITNTILLRSGHPINEANSKARYILDSISDSIKILNN
jgi:D-glycero-D-manno-heptose 1,7-bisphosphate phosphatase